MVRGLNAACTALHSTKSSEVYKSELASYSEHGGVMTEAFPLTLNRAEV